MSVGSILGPVIAGGLFDKNINFPYGFGAIILLATLFITVNRPKPEKERTVAHE
ncbi:hypothetical protein D3C75_1318080 [compost metagenome]